MSNGPPDRTPVLHQDLRALGYCNVGVRAWLARRGLSWQALLAGNLTVHDLRDYLGDVQCARAVANARAREREEPLPHVKPFRAAGRRPRPVAR